MKPENELNVKGHHNRPDLVGEHKFGDAGQLILLVVFLAVWVSDSFIFHYSDFLAQYVNLSIRIILAAIVLTISFIMARKSLNTIFGTVRERPILIRDGLFRIVRHPVYFSAILLYLGLITLTLSLASVGVWIITILFYIFICKYEEKILIQEFGEDYLQYKKEVPMLIPNLFRNW